MRIQFTAEQTQRATWMNLLLSCLVSFLVL